MHQEGVALQSQYILGKLSSMGKGCINNTIHDTNNKATSIVWMTSYAKDNFESFGNYLSIDVMRSSVCHAIFFVTLIQLF